MLQIDSNPILSKLPNHLKQFIVDQNHDAYTPRDHAVWRYVMHQNVRFFKNTAHHSYLQGLKDTGIGTERVPNVNDMNDILGNIGWAAVTVDGFIPPAAFMEFQALNVLPIAADIRHVDNILYTPAPDIIHEAAGHAPIIADTEYAAYLKKIGEVGAKAISSKEDFDLYEAIRSLSILMEASNTPANEIENAQALVEQRQKSITTESEMGKLRRLHWWTVEYGLVGDVSDPKIYGAGLLSSIGESAKCLKEGVKKLPYTVDACNVEFDITKPQPQLFVTPDFNHLNNVLDEFSSSMGFRNGGLKFIQTIIKTKNPGTCVYSSGLQVSGVFTEVLTDSNDHAIYIKTTGPTNLAFEDKELDGHGINYHRDGFGSPVGKLKDSDEPLENFSEIKLSNVGVQLNAPTKLEFESGICVNGIPSNVLFKNDRLVLISFKNCSVLVDDTVLFHPEWGAYDMAVGAEIVSVYSGSADKDAYNQPPLVSNIRTDSVDVNDEMKELFSYYQKVRRIRIANEFSSFDLLWKTVQESYPSEWLLLLELWEMARAKSLDCFSDINTHLVNLSNTKKDISALITEGMVMIEESLITPKLQKKSVTPA